MKRFKFIYILLLLVAVFITSCSNDEPTGENSTARKDGKVSVRLRLSQASSTVTTRAEDSNAEEKELMNIWTVIITNQSDQVMDILTCMPADTDREIDVIEETVELTTGAYNFYSFANIDALHLAKLLGFAEANATSQSVIPEPLTEKGKIAHAKSITNLKFPDGKTWDDYTANVNGNKFNAFDDSNKDNGFGYYGIPMSNRQTLAISDDTSVDLIVVRMLAKIKLQITNGSADDVTVKSVTLTDITKYDADSPNLKLFPRYTSTEIPNGSDLMAGYEHGDIQPNLNGTPDTEEVTIEAKDENGNFVSVASGDTKEITFYVNESHTPNTSQNLYKHFYLKLNLAKSGGAETTTEVTEQRYAMIDDSNADGSTDKWDYIARNDYRIIPISLDDYKFELIPYDFPAIGVYPASVKEEDGLNTITFHDYGHFHLLPKVTKFTTSGAESVSFGTGNETWSLKGDTFKNAWGSWDDHTKASDTNVALFYGAGSFADGNGNANINDGDDAGGFPVWYANDNTNDNTKSQWSPDGTNYQPFIFGYIADPGGKLDEDRKVYHEFTIVINKDGSAKREMTYRLYMILDTEQMMYGRSRKFVAPSAHHKC